jgi:hypothetical protein
VEVCECRPRDIRRAEQVRPYHTVEHLDRDVFEAPEGGDGRRLHRHVNLPEPGNRSIKEDLNLGCVGNVGRLDQNVGGPRGPAFVCDAPEGLTGA